jgi:hypothetical protein
LDGECSTNENRLIEDGKFNIPVSGHKGFLLERATVIYLPVSRQRKAIHLH